MQEKILVTKVKYFMENPALGPPSEAGGGGSRPQDPTGQAADGQQPAR